MVGNVIWTAALLFAAVMVLFAFAQAVALLAFELSEWRQGRKQKKAGR